jgi:predicted nucleotidyltransferase
VRRHMVAGREDLSPERTGEIEALMRVVERWAEDSDDIQAVAVVGSWARGEARMDSDVDLCVLTTTPSRYLRDTDWIRTFSSSRIVRERSFGMVEERRLALASGLEVELGITTPAWATTGHLDEATAAVVRKGLIILYDPNGLLRKLVADVSPELEDRAT